MLATATFKYARALFVMHLIVSTESGDIMTMGSSKLTVKASRCPRKWHWPNNEKIAFGVCVAFEAFEKQSQVNYIATKGERDLYSLSYGDYGWKSGIWRLLGLFDEYGIKTSVGTSGLAAERNPDVIQLLVAEGHEIVAHGWANDVYTKELGRKKERAEIIRCTELLTQVSKGVRPSGWVSPGVSASAHTVELLREQDYEWVGDNASDDLPFIEKTKFGDIAILPTQSTFTNDIAALVFPANPPSVFFECFVDSFDQLYAEGEAGCPKWIELTLHAHMAGRAVMGPTLRKIFDYVKKHEDVFYSRRSDIAKWARERLIG
jgi:peptidoglycan/xylan/chitin deacetylase (PgdA/CDA1 family)